MFQTFQFCRATGRRLKAYFARILAKLKPNGTTKIALEISIPLFLKITVEHTFKSATRKR